MKLWIRVSLMVICILVVAVGAAGTVTLLQARASLVDLAIDRAVSVHGAARQTLEQQALFYGQNSKSEIAFRSLLRYILAQRVGGESALVCDGEVIYSTLSVPPADALKKIQLEGRGRAFFDVNGRRVVVSGDLPLNGETYQLMTESDIDAVDQTVRSMTLRSAAISFGCALLGVLLVMLAVRRATRPLHQLALSAQSIAQGEYSRRAAIHSSDEVGALAQDFNTMAEAVEAKVGALTAASERQQAFVNAMSHEMRTPVTSIVGYAETLLTTDMPREVQEEALLQIHAQSKWLERLSQKMLSLLVIEKGIEAKPVSVPELLDAVCEATRKLMDERQTPLVIECEVDTLLLDADLMASALINLVDNASKASPKGAAVLLSADENGFCVQDQGIGILPADLESITQPFFTGSASRSKRQGGVGLGLAIVQRVAQAHGAELRIESRLGRGTKMSLEFDENKTFANR